MENEISMKKNHGGESCVEEYKELSLSLACSDFEGKLLPDQCYVAVDGVALPGGTEIVVARFPNHVVTDTTIMTCVDPPPGYIMPEIVVAQSELPGV